MAGTDKTKINLQWGPAIILVAPQLPENIGMAARAMANFGLIDLRIVAPREKFPSEKAFSAASKANYILEQAKLYDNLEQALQDLNYVYATTARLRYSHKLSASVEQAMQHSYNLMQDKSKKVGIMFGRERVGLLNSEISLADKTITFNTNPAFASLNIAQAVLLISYEWLRAASCQSLPQNAEFAIAQKQHLYSLFKHLEDALDKRGYFRPVARKEAMVNNLRAVFTRPGFSEEELKLLRGVISSLDNFLPKT